MSFSSPWLLVMKASRVSMAILDATSPALWPPIPSHTAYRFVSGFTRTLSSLSFRRRPTSVFPNASSINSPPPRAARAAGRKIGAKNNGAGRRGSRFGRAHGRAHLAHRALHPHQHGAGHDVVADVELRHLRDGGHARGVRVGEAVAGVDHEAELAAQLRRIHDLAEGGLAGSIVAGVGVGRGVDLQGAGSDAMALLDLLQVGIDEEADPDPAVLDHLDPRAQVHAVEHHVQAALRGELLPP